MHTHSIASIPESGLIFFLRCQFVDELAKLPEMLADAQVARRQSKYGRDPTDQQRSWLVNKVRSDIAMIGTKLNAQVIIKNFQNMPAKSLPPREREREWLQLEYQDWAGLQGRGPHSACDGTGTRDWPLPGPIQELAPDP